jgi:hypothetical protein
MVLCQPLNSAARAFSQLREDSLDLNSVSRYWVLAPWRIGPSHPCDPQAPDSRGPSHERIPQMAY